MTFLATSGFHDDRQPHGRSDFIIIGTGAGGLSAALHASEHGRVIMLTKREALDSNSNWAQGGIACVTAGDDSIEKHVSDTLIAGGGLCKETAVRTIVTELARPALRNWWIGGCTLINAKPKAGILSSI